MSDHRSRSIRVPAGVPAGVLATVTMDVAMVAAERFGGSAFTSERLGPDMIGRWAAGPGCAAAGATMTSLASRRGAVSLRWACSRTTPRASSSRRHSCFFRVAGMARTSLAVGTAYGIATAALPLLVMFPSMGYGWFGLRSGDAARINRIMLLGHTAFGVGIGLWAPRFAARRPRP